jgi:MFS family permease
MKRRAALLATTWLAALTINLDTTIVNVALPSLARELEADTRDLLWVVDGYNLAFAALVLAMGSLSDRFGRHPALVVGLAGFATASGVAALVDSVEALIALRVVMGVSAALIFPTTLSIIASTYTERRERATALGIWGRRSAPAWRSARCRAACCSSTSRGTASSGRSSRSASSRSA